MPFVLEKNVVKALISVEDLRQLIDNCRTKVGTTKDRFIRGTTHEGGILSRFLDNSQISHTCMGFLRPHIP